MGIKDIIAMIKDGDKRTALFKINVIGSFFIKGWTSLVQLLLVPLTLNCLNQFEYGIWLTISSLLIWIDAFDIGLGNGLRNSLVEALADKNYQRCKRLISTTFIMLTLLIIFSVGLLILILNTSINIYTALNVTQEAAPNLPIVVTTALAIVGLTFIFKIIGNIYLALQLPAINNLLIAIGQTIALIIIFLLSHTEGVSLLDIAIAYTLSPLITYIIAYPITFSKYKHLRPSLKLFDATELRPLFSLGVKFFFIQIGGLIIFASSNLLISRLSSATDVTLYQISYRYFGIINMLFTIISAPLWAATTDAYIKGDWQWINQTTQKMNKIVGAFTIIIALMYLVANYVYLLWVGKTIEIPNELSLAMAIYMVIIIYGTCYSNLICGMGKIRLLTLITIAEAIVYIPLATYCHSIWGLKGIIYALIAVNLISAVVNKIQFNKLKSGKAKGIWNY